MSNGITTRRSRTRAAGHSAGSDLIGFHVEGTDGRIGTVDRLSGHVDARYLIVHTGPWIFGRLVLLPAGTVVRVEPGERTVHVDRSKEQIRRSPAYDGGTPEAEPDPRAPYTVRCSTFYRGRML
ncbi:PRC-barrel domain-containing protein [Kitasatospora cinereorecta]|uniref:PRC-barrel domain-containing protein n=1 Tax=Kitasatospora cinereorecta TaxID=285560 RepID=A0ABW0VBX9_9ACTN